jgi:hypothetical protein
MAHVINDRVKETTTTTGTGAVSLAGAVTGFETFAAGIGNSNTTYYAIVHQTAAEFEVGLGTLDGDSSDLTRTTVISSSNSDSAVDFAAGTKDVFCTIPASKLIFEDNNNDATVGRNLTVTGDLTVSGDDITMGTNTAGNLLIADGTNFNSIAVGGLSEISTVASDDVIMAVDTSGGGLKKITRANLVSGLAAGTMSNVVDDTSPQLGGDLDVNGQDIVSASNGNITLTPNGSGVVRIDGSSGIDMQSGSLSIKNSGTQSYIDFYCESSNAHYARLQAPAHSAFSGNATITLPSDTTILASTNLAETLSNKTLSTPNIAEIDSTDSITLDAATDIILDAGGGDFNFKDDGTEILRITNSSSDVIIRPVVDAKDLIFQQRDGTEVARVEDNGTFNVVTDKLAINGTAITSTAAELNIMDGGTSATSTTLADADRLVVNDNGTMVQVAVTDLTTYINSNASFASKGFATAMAIAL